MRNLTIGVGKAQPPSEPRTALVIGNADYAAAPLANPVNDARAMAQKLTALGFQVVRLENGTQDQMYEAIRRFGDQLRGGGVGLFYYAGHALQVRGRNYLLPARALIEREDEILYRTVDTGQILDKMESARNRVNVVILDACRNNPFGREFRNVSPGLAVVDAPHNTLIAFATAPGAVASDGGGRNGLYTQHLLRSLDSPGLGLEDVFKKVRAGVRQESAGRQVPWENTSLEVDFYFDPLPNQMAAAAPGSPVSPDPLTVELAFWDSVKGSTDPDDHRAYLKRYPDGQFAVLARNRLRTLGAPPPSAAPATPATTAVAGPASAPPASPPPVPVPAPATVAAPAPVVAPAPTVAVMTVPAAPAVIAVPLPGSPPARPPAPLQEASPRVLMGQSGPVLAVALSRNGAQALTGAADHSLRQWDLATGRELRKLIGHAAAVTATAIATDSRQFLSGGADRSVRLWDATSGAELARLQGHAAAVAAVAFGPTSRYGASVAVDGELMLWELPGGSLLRRARLDDRGLRSVAISPEGRYVLTAADDGAVRLWDVGTLLVVRSFGPMAAAAVAAAFSADGLHITAVDAGGEVWSWDAREGRLLHRFATVAAPPSTAVVAGDGGTVLTASATGSLVWWDVGTGAALWRSGGPGFPVSAIALGPRGLVALSASDDQRLLLWTPAP